MARSAKNVEPAEEVPADGAEDDSHLSEFARTLKRLRKQRGLSQAVVAQLADVSIGYVGLIETGQRGARPSFDTVKKFAQALALNVGDSEELMRASGHLGLGESLWMNNDKFTVSSAIDNDPRLTDEQKVILIGVYDNMVRGSATPAAKRSRKAG